MLKRIFSAVMFILLLTSMLTLAFNIQPVKASGTIYIRADGSIDPPDVPISTSDNVTYTFTNNIASDADGIVVERSNITIDGSGYVLQGTGAYDSKGVFASGISNITVTNATVRDFYSGIYLNSTSIATISENNIIDSTWGAMTCYSSNNDLEKNNMTNNWGGILISDCSGNHVFGNRIARSYCGIELSSSSGDTISGNTMSNNDYGFSVEGLELGHFLHSIDPSNLVDDKPVYYLVNQTDRMIMPPAHSEVGYLALVNCMNLTIRDLTLSNNRQGLLVAYTNYSHVLNNTVMKTDYAIRLIESSHNSVEGNNITNSLNRGIVLESSSYNEVHANRIVTSFAAIYLDKSSSNLVSNNYIENNDAGSISIGYGSSHNSILNNSILNNWRGISLTFDLGGNVVSGNNIVHNAELALYLWGSSRNVFYDNNITNNDYGFHISDSSDNIFYHNNFIENGFQNEYLEGLNNWDDGYLHGGNYWSDYSGVDEKSGPYQNQTGGDGLGDTPYIINSYNRDNFPLMTPWIPTPPTSYVIKVPTNIPTIQEAINVAGRGDTVFVYNGTYHERLGIAKPVLLIGEDPTTTIIDGEGIGDVVEIGADNVLVQNFTIRNSGTDYSSAGISVENSGSADWRYGNAIISSNIIANNAWGIEFYYSSDNIVLENNITDNANGIILYSSSNNAISENNVMGNQHNGIQFSESSSNNVSGNIIENNGDCGIGFFTTSSDNTITGNNLTNNKYGAYLQQAYNNMFYHNNFISNLNQAYAAPPLYGIVSANIWDNGYPSGGNYWSDYNGTDANHDGIGDTPYVIDENNTDHYPLMVQYAIPEFPSFLILPLFFIATSLTVIVYTRKYFYSPER